MEEPSDEKLMSGYLEGDINSFEQLFSRYDARLRAFFRKRLAPQHAEEVDDFFQMTWLKVHNSKSQFKREQRFSPWFYTIALNTLRDYLRSSHAKVQNLSFDETQISAEEEKNIEQLVISKEDLDQVTSYLHQLPDLQKEILLLSDWEGFGSQEIGQILSIRDTNVRKQLSRARKSLRQHLENLRK